jgi:hypothetical protein
VEVAGGVARAPALSRGEQLLESSKEERRNALRELKESWNVCFASCFQLSVCFWVVQLCDF